jgi:leucyl-tRNA synthetase
MGVTFCAVAPSTRWPRTPPRQPALAAFIESASRAAPPRPNWPEKEGLPTGLFVTHPLTGEVEVWVGNYVLMSYGDGAVMGVPAHDERDFAFASSTACRSSRWCRGRQTLTTRLAGVVRRQAARRLPSTPASTTAWLQGRGRRRGRGAGQGPGREEDHLAPARLGHQPPALLGHAHPHHPLRRLRPVPVPEKDLPVVLPQDLVPDGSGNPLNKCEAFLNVTCPCCGKPARRETDTMDTFVDSSWYFMRYCDPKNSQAMVADGADYWMPMDQYIGGIEHAILHLLYARFWTKVMRDLGLVRSTSPSPSC